MRPVKVLVNADLGEPQRERILASAPFAEVVFPPGPDDELREARDADVVFGRITPRLFEHAPMLRWVQSLGAGVDGSLFPELVESPVVLTSEKGHVGPHLAEQAFALLLALTRGVARSVRERTWENKASIRSECWELTDRTLGIVGLGGTGLEVARRAAAFGMRVVAVDPEEVVRAAVRDPRLEPMDGLPRLLGESDAVVICAPLTDAHARTVRPGRLRADAAARRPR